MTVGLVRGACNLRGMLWVVVQVDLTVGRKADGGGKRSRSDGSTSVETCKDGWSSVCINESEC